MSAGSDVSESYPPQNLQNSVSTQGAGGGGQGGTGKESTAVNVCANSPASLGAGDEPRGAGLGAGAEPAPGVPRGPLPRSRLSHLDATQRQKRLSCGPAFGLRISTDCGMVSSTCWTLRGIVKRGKFNTKASRTVSKEPPLTAVGATALPELFSSSPNGPAKGQRSDNVAFLREPGTSACMCGLRSRDFCGEILTFRPTRFPIP